MSSRLKAVFVVLMSTALAFGFLHTFISGKTYNFERLHIFLFNLCSGGTILLHFTQRLKKTNLKTALFLVLSLCYAVFAFLEMYPPAVIIAFILAGIVESVRITKYSWFPENFFKKDVNVAEKFNQAALLCLSIGLVISAMVIVNNEYLKLITLEKLQLDTFFLGFSFPLSLITMCVMFSIMQPNIQSQSCLIKNICFWTVNLGVIIFFSFILIEMLVPQVVVTTLLFICVIVIFLMFVKNVKRLQQKNFLTSGMMFLIYAAFTGILYIILNFFPVYYEKSSQLILKLHSFSALYGWNLSGLAVICRYNDFPIRLHSSSLIAAHWIIVALFAPLGYYYKPFAVIASLCYLGFLYLLFFTKGLKEQPAA